MPMPTKRKPKVTKVLLYSQAEVRAAAHRREKVFALHGWLQSVTLDELIELYWQAQALRAADEEKNAAQVANPDSMVGKSVEYVTEYHRRKLAAQPVP